MNFLSNLDGFEWDDGNRTKNWVKHQVSTAECEEVFFNLPLLLANDVQHSQEEQRF
ncbi:MAG: BrnT family toxin, partial [Anaerolineales bacterium]|nr:BrnT family toxin [Anaerolineales bacterium]